MEEGGIDDQNVGGRVVTTDTEPGIGEACAACALYLRVLLAQVLDVHVVSATEDVAVAKVGAKHFYPVSMGHLPVNALLLPHVKTNEHDEHQRHAQTKEIDKGVALVARKENEKTLHHFILNSL